MIDWIQEISNTPKAGDAELALWKADFDNRQMILRAVAEDGREVAKAVPFVIIEQAIINPLILQFEGMIVELGKRIN